MIHVYSPLPIDAYRLPGLDSDEVTIIQKSDFKGSLWNLFWLSTPGIDTVPGAHKWWDHYRPHRYALSAMIKDLHGDAALAEKLVAHPETFLAWFDRQDRSVYECYDELGGNTWVETVVSRAVIASSRHAVDTVATVETSGNVIRVKFR